MSEKSGHYDAYDYRREIKEWEALHGDKIYLNPEDFTIPKWLGGKDDKRRNGSKDDSESKKE